MTPICEVCEESIAEDECDGKVVCLNCRDAAASIDHNEGCTATEDCMCGPCVEDRQWFDAWVADTDNRWARAWAEGKVAHLHSKPCRNPSCPDYAVEIGYSGLVVIR